MEILIPEHPRWEEFTSRLGGPEGCNFRDVGDDTEWECDNTERRPLATAILESMGGFDISRTLAYFTDHGGCDCEILFNVDPPLKYKAGRQQNCPVSVRTFYASAYRLIASQRYRLSALQILAEQFYKGSNHGKGGKPNSLRNVLCLSFASVIFCSNDRIFAFTVCKTISSSATAVLM
jgi:hypothetical protein